MSDICAPGAGVGVLEKRGKAEGSAALHPVNSQRLLMVRRHVSGVSSSPKL